MLRVISSVHSATAQHQSAQQFCSNALVAPQERSKRPRSLNPLLLWQLRAASLQPPSDTSANGCTSSLAPASRTAAATPVPKHQQVKQSPAWLQSSITACHGSLLPHIMILLRSGSTARTNGELGVQRTAQSLDEGPALRKHSRLAVL